MKKFKLLMAVLASFSLLLLVTGFNDPQDQKKGGPWEVPAKYKEMKNPHAADNSLVSVGKTLYMKHCRSCHGNAGLGDGPKAKMLPTSIGSFAAPEFQAQTDGVIFYQSIIGRGDMPNYESKIADEEDQWAVVMYLRSLK